MSSWWPENNCCRPSKLAEFVGGMGAYDTCIRDGQMETSTCCLDQCQPTPTRCTDPCQSTPTRCTDPCQPTMPPCCPPRPESPPTHIVYIPIHLPSRPKTPPRPKNQLTSIDILEELIPSELRSGLCCDCCDVMSIPTTVDPCSCTSSRSHRITFQEACPPRRNTAKWQNNSLPKPNPRNPLNPCPPECDSSDSSEDEEEEDELPEVYHYNKKKGRFEPGPPPRKRGHRIILQMPEQCPCQCSCSQPSPVGQPFPVPYPVTTTYPATLAGPFSNLCNPFGGTFPPSCNQ